MKNGTLHETVDHNGRLLQVAVVLAMFLLFGLANAAGAVAQPPESMSLQLRAPEQVTVGDPIEIVLTVDHARELAGYEALVLFDTSAAEFGGLLQHDNDLAQLGRDVGSLSALNLPSGAAIGLYSCPLADCLKVEISEIVGGNGQVQLARVVIVPKVQGTLEIALAATKFVDVTGQPLAVQIPQAAVQVDVTSSEGTTSVDSVNAFYTAPSPAWSLSPERGEPTGLFDLSGDGEINLVDVAEAAVEWQLARLNGAPCSLDAGALVNPEEGAPAEQGSRFDVNSDGCLDVADVQVIAANLGRSEAASEGEPEVAAPGGIDLVVNVATDGDDAAPGDGQCLTASGYCTLRAAITEADAQPGSNNISFDIPGDGVKTIQLTGRLPTISDQNGPLIIDGYTQPGASPNSDPEISNAAIMIQIEGQGEDVHDGFVITSPDNVIRGVAIYKVRRSFWIYGKGASGNVLTGNFVGTDAAGSYGACCSVANAHGIHIEQEAAKNQVGGTSPAERNVISGNAQSGIGIWHVGSDANVVVNNLVGLSPDGTERLANRRHGIDLNFGSAGNIVGGLGEGERNVSSGNDFSGLEVSHLPETGNNHIAGNFIGTDVSGEQATSWSYNGYTGITIEQGASNNVVEGNVVANGNEGGIQLTGSETLNNQIFGNWIGVSRSGAPLGNGLFGIRADALYTMIGPDNVIAYNEFNGVVIREDDKHFNTITRNSIYGNGALGIDLYPAGVNANDDGDADTGPNQRLNFPVISSITGGEISGTACPSCLVELFIADGVEGGYGQGRTFLGEATAGSDGSFSLPVSGLSDGDLVTATATDEQGNTSEFSQNVIAGEAPQPSSWELYLPVTFGAQ